MFKDSVKNVKTYELEHVDRFGFVGDHEKFWMKCWY